MQRSTHHSHEQERRHAKDGWFRLLQIASASGWFMFIAASVVYHFARPELQTGVQRFWGIEVREQWDQHLLSWLMALLAVCVLLSLTGVWLRFKRARRQTDASWSNVFFLLIAAGSGLLLLLL